MSETLLYQHRHLFDGMRHDPPLKSLEWTLDAITSDTFRRKAIQIPYLATPMGAPFIANFLSGFSQAWLQHHSDTKGTYKVTPN